MTADALQHQPDSAAELSDEHLVERARLGDTTSFELLMRRNNVRVYRALRSLLRNEAEIEDAMQAAYLSAFANLSSFRGTARFSTWLTQIAVNEGLGRLRHDRRRPAVSLTLVEEPMMPPSGAPPETPERLAGNRELAGILERAVDALPEAHRVVFMLREIEGMDTAQTAAAMQLSEEVVRTRLSRARASLRGTIERLVGGAARDAFDFHASRCDRVVASVLEQLKEPPSTD